MQLEKPFIIIGTGRSGSQMLSRMLGRHSSVNMCSEAMFIIPRLWMELVEHAGLGSNYLEQTNLNVTADSASQIQNLRKGATEDIRRYMRRGGGKRLRLKDLPVDAAAIESISHKGCLAIRSALVPFF